MVRRLAKRVSAPSITDALNGNFRDKDVISAKEQHEMYSGAKQTEKFTAGQFAEKWSLFLAEVDSASLKTTLARVPEFRDDYQFVLKIENTVQEEAVRNIKPKLVTWLRKELKNSDIDLFTKIEEVEATKLIYSDNEKFQEMVKKNPALNLLRQKFNLDFSE